MKTTPSCDADIGRWFSEDAEIVSTGKYPRGVAHCHTFRILEIDIDARGRDSRSRIVTIGIKCPAPYAAWRSPEDVLWDFIERVSTGYSGLMHRYDTSFRDRLNTVLAGGQFGGVYVQGSCIRFGEYGFSLCIVEVTSDKERGIVPFFKLMVSIALLKSLFVRLILHQFP